jgi:hypothetical protein
MVVSYTEKMAEDAAPLKIQVIVVAGVTSGAGKTSVAEAVTRLLARRHSTAAAKITVTHGERGCPHGGKGCNVCGSLGGEFQIITREGVISQPGTDTARLYEAGARPVLWTIAREQSVQDAWREMLTLMSGARCAVIESNTLALLITPALTLMVVDPSVSRRLWKPSAERLIATADYLIFNDRGAEDKRRKLLEEIARLRGTKNGLLFVAHPHEIENQIAIKGRLEEVFAEGSA